MFFFFFFFFLTRFHSIPISWPDIDCVGVYHCPPEKGRKEIVEEMEEMKERDREERGK